MSETQEFITLPNRIRVRSDFFFNKTFKKEKSKVSQRSVIQKADEFSEEFCRTVAASNPKPKPVPKNAITSDDAPANNKQKKANLPPLSNDNELEQVSSANHKLSSKTLKSPKTSTRKRKKKKNSPVLPLEYFIPKNISIGSFAFIPSEGSCFKVVDKDAKGIF